jgi:hypothetical protein
MQTTPSCYIQDCCHYHCWGYSSVRGLHWGPSVSVYVSMFSELMNHCTPKFGPIWHDDAFQFERRWSCTLSPLFPTHPTHDYQQQSLTVSWPVIHIECYIRIHTIENIFELCDA